MALDESVHGMRLPVIERANGRQHQRRLQEAGHLPDAILSLAHTAGTVRQRRAASRRLRSQPGRPVATPPESGRLVLEIAISTATWGCRRIAAYLARTRDLRWHPAPCSAAGPRRGRAATATFLRDDRSADACSAIANGQDSVEGQD